MRIAPIPPLSMLVNFILAIYVFKNYFGGGGTWVAQFAKHLILDFGSGHDLIVWGIGPRVVLCADSAQPAWDSLSPCLSASPPFVHAFSLSLSQNK